MLSGGECGDNQPSEKPVSKIEGHLKSLRKHLTCLVMALVLLPVLASCVWYARQSRQQRLDHALIEAIKKSDTQTAIALLDAGADANATDKPVRQQPVAQILFDCWDRLRGKKPPADAKPYDPAILVLLRNDGAKNAPLYPENARLMAALLDHGANSNAKDTAGNSALSQAVQNDFHTSVRLLLEHGANPHLQGSGDLLLSEADLENRQLLLKYGADINATTETGRTALMQAAGWGTKEDVAWLLQHGADINRQDEDGGTAVMYAVGKGREENVEALLRWHPHLSLQNKMGLTALQMAQASEGPTPFHQDEDEWPLIIRLLKKAMLRQATVPSSQTRDRSRLR
jgi:hypothetical protein